MLSWNQVLLYPKGWPARELTFDASLRLPDGWKYGTALPVEKESGNKINFNPAPLNTLVDSPVISGHYFRKIQLTPGQTPSHEMDMAADSPAALEMPAETQLAYKRWCGDGRALRFAALSRLSFSGHAERQRGAFRAGASRVKRRSRERAHDD